MAGYRISRIGEEVRRELSDALREVKDPRVRGGLVSITHVEVTPDLKYAKVYYSAVGKGAEPEEVGKGLRSAGGFLRFRLAKTLNLRQTPALSFLYDPSMEAGAHISALLRQVEPAAAEGADSADAPADSAEKEPLQP